MWDFARSLVGIYSWFLPILFRANNSHKQSERSNVSLLKGMTEFRVGEVFLICRKINFDSWPRSWVLLFTSEALQMRIFSSPHEYDNLRIWISLHWNMFLILNLVLMPTNDNEARSESTNHSVAPPLRPRRRRQLHTNKSTQQAAGNMN